MPYSEVLIKRCERGFGRKALTQEGFIEKAINVHGNKYDYSKVNLNKVLFTISTDKDAHPVTDH
jgi:hypothetical protein